MNDDVKQNTIFANSDDEFARAALEVFLTRAKKVIEQEGVFNVAISGGNSPIPFFKALANVKKSDGFRWESVHLFWVDERCVSIDSSDSNYKSAYDTFISKVDLPSANIHRIKAGENDPPTAAQLYKEEIVNHFGLEQDQVPNFDLILLGMGDDAHTASLFPDNKVHGIKGEIVMPVFLSQGKLDRVTISADVIQAAKEIVVLMKPKSKYQLLETLLVADVNEKKYPIQYLWPVLYKVTWIVG